MGGFLMTHEFSICNELRTLGITANYKGYKQAAWAIHLALDDERRLDDISKEIYQPIAQLFFCYINSVERNLRTVSRRAWTLQREHFQEIAGCDLPAPPTASAFLRILVNHLRTNVLPTESTEPTVQ